uniref:Uncharacterized protein n=1 Tax=Ditylum brightwellii TaxID=49249 RepID=A0A7S4V158_9STRA
MMKICLNIIILFSYITLVKAGSPLEVESNKVDYTRPTSFSTIRGAVTSLTSNIAHESGRSVEDAADTRHLKGFSVLSLDAIPMIEEGTLHRPRYLIEDDHDEEDGLDNHHDEDGDHHDEEEDHHEEEEDHHLDDHDGDGDHHDEDGDHHDEDHHDEDGDHHDEDGDHHLDDHGHSSHSEDSEKRPWGKVIGASLLINLATLSGVILLIPLVASVSHCNKDSITRRSLRQMYGSYQGKMLDIVIPSFACGALLAAAVFLIMPEALHLIESGSKSVSDGHDHGGDDGHGHRRYLEGEGNSESDTAWKFGTSIIGGFLLPIVLGAFFPRPKEDELLSDSHENDTVQKEDMDVFTDESAVKVNPDKGDFDDDIITAAKPVVETLNLSTNCEDNSDYKLRNHARRQINYRLCVSILLGDGFHNFADGIFVGSAFLLCSNSVAISIMAATLYHEIAQELADFFLLTGHGGLSVISALCLNFVSGLSVLLGAIIVVAANFTTEAIGAILGIAAGVYIHVAASECVPRIDAAMDRWQDRVLSVLMFALGAIPIGLVLLNHEHCEG